MDTTTISRTREAIVRAAHRSGHDRVAFYRGTAAALQRAVPFDGACWITLDPATLLFTNHFSDDLASEGFPHLCRNEYAEEDVNKIATLTRSFRPVGILSHATDGEPERSARYRTILAPFGLHGELRVSFMDGTTAWGCAILLRGADRPDFTSEEAAFVAEVSATVAHGFRTALLPTLLDAPESPAVPGVVLLDEDGRIDAMTGNAEHWVAGLGVLEPAATGPLPSVVLSVASRARQAAGSGAVTDSARARARTASGEWLVLHATVMDTDAGSRTAVILEPARPTALAPLIADAYGLTSREREVVRLVLQGLPTERIAAELHLSAWTVQDPTSSRSSTRWRYGAARSSSRRSSSSSTSPGSSTTASTSAPTAGSPGADRDPAPPAGAWRSTSHPRGILAVRARNVGGHVLHIHRSARGDLLVSALADLLSEPLADPMAAEVVSVHSQGIERWITQELSTRLGASPDRADGVCANIEFPFPSRVVGGALSAAVDIGLDDDPWSPARLVWPVLTTIEETIDESWLAPVARHLGRGHDHDEDDRQGRRFGTARRIADLFDRYAIHRPDMLRAWHRKEDVDGRSRPLATEHRWQPQLWRAVCERVDVPSTVERLDDAVAALRAGEVEVALPPRLSLFGLTAVPTTYVEVLAALAAHRDVHLFLLHPSPDLWDRTGAILDGADRERALGPRDRDPTREVASNPILASWGRDSREMQVVVSSLGGHATDDHRPLEVEAGPLLTRLQSDVQHDAAPPGPPAPGADDRRPLLRADDRSVQVHACHGRTRQVEVLRDGILHLLAGNEDLEPRDIVVMCPRIEDFAPLIEAVFGAETGAEDAPTAGDDGPPDLRVRLADRALLQTNPILQVAAQVLELADGRVTASDVLDLVNRAPVRRRFRFDDEAVERIEDWVDGLGVRWGLDVDHRADHGLEGIDANTWRAGADRLLLGVAMADEDLRTVGGAVPYDDVEGSDVELAGRFAELLDRLDDAVRNLNTPQSVDAWRDALVAAVDSLSDTTDRDAWQRHQLTRVLGEVVDEAHDGDTVCPIDLTLSEVRTLLDRRLQGRPSRASHRTGDLTVCTLVPMRSVPHRVVCLLGMDDEAFPRRTVPDGDDLIDLDPCVGDRDERTEDRQLLLDALLAARDHLVITYTGRDERTNETRAPAVPVGELLDVIDRTVRIDERGEDGEPLPARERVVTEHPLQPFDRRNFTPDELGVAGPWSFDPTDLAGALALSSPRDDRAAFLDRPLPPDDRDLVALDDLVSFLQHPVRAFLNQRLQVFLPSRAEESSDGIPVELGPLEEWQVGERLLTERLAGHDPDRWAQVERARGTLPPGALADAVIEDVRSTVDVMFDVAAELGCDGPARRGVELDVPLNDGRNLVGTLNGVHDDAIVSFTYSRLGPRHRLAAWAHLVAATLADPTVPWRTVTICRAVSTRKGTRTVSWAVQGPLGEDPATRARTASRLLDRLLDLYDRGMREPLPLYCKTSAEVARLIADGKNLWKADGTWESGWWPAEDRDPEHVLVLGHDVPFEQVVATAARDDECGDDWYEQHDPEGSRLVRYALRVWAPLLGVGQDAPFEEVDHR